MALASPYRLADSSESYQVTHPSPMFKGLFRVAAHIEKYFYIRLTEAVKSAVHYRKVPKFWDARNLCCNLPKIQTKMPNLKGILSKLCKCNSKQ